MNEPLSLQDAATRTGTTVSALRQAIKRGRLTASLVDGKHGTMYTVLPSDLDAYMGDRKNPIQKGSNKGLKDDSKGGSREQVERPPSDVEATSQAILDELRLLRATVEQQAYKIGSLEQELHDTKSQLSSQLGQLQKALPAPNTKGWLGRLLMKKDS